jgi:VCBS repeat-containing protein
MLLQIRKYSLFALVILAFFVPIANAQVVFSLPSISGSPGQTVTIPLSVTGVPESGGFSSFSFDVVSSSPAVVFKGGLQATTLVQAAGWTFASNAVANGGPNNRVAGFGTTSPSGKIGTNGVLVFLQFQIASVTPGTTVTLTKLALKFGATDVPFTPAIPSTGLNASNSPVATNDSYQLQEGATLTVPAGTGVLANDTDQDLDPLTAAVGTTTTNGTLTLAADGSFTYVHNGSETITDSFTYSVSDGSTTDTGTVTFTIVPVNDVPTFTLEMVDQSVDEGALVTGDYNATDAEGATVTFALVSGPAGAAVNPATGEFGYLAPAGSAGVYPIVVSASDGIGTSQSTFTLTVRSVKKYSGTLSGLHQTTIPASSGSGSIAVDFISNTNQLIVSGSFSGLSSSLVLAQIQSGILGQDGDGIISLTPSLVGNGSAGNFATALNTFDLNTFVFPAGWNPALFEQALTAGSLYVNLRTVNVLTGELRTQLRVLTNTAPAAVNVSGPNSVAVSGNPTDAAYELTWTAGAADAQGDATRLVLEVASDVLFSSIKSVTNVTSAPNEKVSVTIDAAAKLYDALSGSTPGNVSVGGSQTAYYRLRRTDGSAISSGTPIAVVLTRGLVTDKQSDYSMPTEFVLRGNYPNPFNPSTTIQFDLPETADVQVDVLDLLGRTMISIPSQSFEAGAKKSVSVDASALSSGIYMYRVIARSVSQTHVSTGTMTLIK